MEHVHPSWERAPLVSIFPDSHVGLMVCTLSCGEVVGKTIAWWWAGWRACSTGQEGAGPSHRHARYSVFLAEDRSASEWSNQLRKSPMK